MMFSVEMNFKVPEGCEPNYFIQDNFRRFTVLDGPRGSWGCYHFEDAGQFENKVLQGVVKTGDVLVVATADEPYRVGKLGAYNAVFIPPRVYRFPKVLPPNTTYKQMMLDVHRGLWQELRDDLGKVPNCPIFAIPDDPPPQEFEARFSEKDWMAMCVADGYAPQNEQMGLN